VSVTLLGLELHRLRMPLVAPFRTSFGVETARDVLLVRALTAAADGWGECVAGAEPLYSVEYVDSAQEVIRRFLFPRLAATAQLTAAEVSTVLASVRGHLMAKAAVELAILDAELRTAGVRLVHHLGGVRERVPAGVSVGIADSIPELLDAVAGYLAAGYLRIKLKIQPGWDVEPVAAVRRAHADVPLQVDANAAYARSDADQLARLDEFGLLLIEQPLPEDDLVGHAELARRLRTPICLDESINSARAAETAIALGACSIVNIKAGRVGGYLEARRVHDLCAAAGVPVWCGGMLETGIGRAANVALAALPNFSMPGDTSASERYFSRDVTAPFVLREGHLDVPAGPGIGVEPDGSVLRELSSSMELLRV